MDNRGCSRGDTGKGSESRGGELGGLGSGRPLMKLRLLCPSISLRTLLRLGEPRRGIMLTPFLSSRVEERWSRYSCTCTGKGDAMLLARRCIWIYIYSTTGTHIRPSNKAAAFLLCPTCLLSSVTIGSATAVCLSHTTPPSSCSPHLSYHPSTSLTSIV